jgi:hypothetical protein
VCVLRLQTTASVSIRQICETSSNPSSQRRQTWEPAWGCGYQKRLLKSTKAQSKYAVPHALDVAEQSPPSFCQARRRIELCHKVRPVRFDQLEPSIDNKSWGNRGMMARCSTSHLGTKQKHFGRPSILMSKTTSSCALTFVALGARGRLGELQSSPRTSFVLLTIEARYRQFRANSFSPNTNQFSKDHFSGQRTLPEDAKRYAACQRPAA